MVRYLTLISFTDEGARNVGDSVRRATDFGNTVAAAGGTLVSQYWAVGQYDGCLVFEAPDETTACSLLVKLAKHGFVRTQSMQVLDNSEFAKVSAS